MAEDTMFAEAVAAVRAGEIVRARDLLSRLLRADSSNPEYWLWMSAVVESERESVYCLRSLTKLRPNHPVARLGLTILGQLSSGTDRTGPSRQQRNGSFPHQTAGRVNSIGEWWKAPRNRENAAIMVLGFAAVAIVLVLVLSQVSLAGLTGSLGAGPVAASNATATATLNAPGGTSVPSPTLHAKATPSDQMLLVDFLGVHPTATPAYGFTPMPSSSALENALKAYGAGDLDGALESLKQVLFVEPRSAQGHYLTAEIYRIQWKMKEAFAEYTAAIDADPDYAPAYLGRAVWSKQSNPDNDYLKDINRALELDPSFINAYMERAEWKGRQGDWPAALEDLERAHQLAPDNVLVIIRIGRAELNLGDPNKALDDLTRAQISDPTILEVYLGLGGAYNDLSLPDLAVSHLVLYTTYAPQDIQGWLELGEAYNGAGEYLKASESCTQVLSFEKNSIRGHLCRGQSYRKLGRKAEALADLQVAADRAPNWYSTQLALGQAQYEAGKPNLAWVTLKKAVELAATPAEKAEAMGWLGFAYEAIKSPAANPLWQELMNLDDASEYWKATAYMHFFGISTPTPEPTATVPVGTSSGSTSTPSP
jgi:tetratricopeptide (TPR) repeat protein